MKTTGIVVLWRLLRMSNDKPQYNTARDILKVIAIIAMTADHASTFFLAEVTVIYAICQFFGNFTIVIMCFFIVRGLRHTRSVLNYALRLLVWAMISEVPFYLLFGMRLNILFTLLASLLIILLIDRKGWPLGIAALMLFFPLSWICDWSIIAPVFTVIYYVLQKRHIEKLSLLLIPASYFIFRNILYYETQVEYVVGTISIFLAALLVYLMMGKASENRKGRIPGIVFYAYYSVHLIIIWIINEAIIL